MDSVLSASDFTTAAKFTPLGAVPADPTNAYADNAAAAALGQRLYFDTSYSGSLNVGADGGNGSLGAVGATGKVACVSCHASTAGDDNRSTPNNVSLGTDYGTRNALPVFNASFNAWTNWGGRFDSQWSLPLAVAENAKIMKSTRLQVAHMLYAKYRTEYDAIFPVPLDTSLDPASGTAARFPASGKPKAAMTDPDGPWELMTAADRTIVNRIYANYGKAIAAYMRKLVSRNAPFDKFVASATEATAISDSAKRGFLLFSSKAKCDKCHTGPNFSDDKFHALGVPQTGANVPATDLGRFADVPGLLGSAFNTAGAYSDDAGTGKLTGLAQAASMMGQFRTMTLRGAGRSAPYMHSGQFATLEQVVDFYNMGGGAVADGGTLDSEIVPLNLTTAERADLVAFLKTLDGEAIPDALLLDTSL
jgi:cytochrome c peroxidase